MTDELFKVLITLALGLRYPLIRIPLDQIDGQHVSGLHRERRRCGRNPIRLECMAADQSGSGEDCGAVELSVHTSQGIRVQTSAADTVRARPLHATELQSGSQPLLSGMASEEVVMSCVTRHPLMDVFV